jgi:hypothetical protein
MKTLGKLKLKSEKMLTSEELLGFRGGSGSSSTTCEMCHQAVYWDCQGYGTNTIWYLDCLQEGHAGCDALAC